MVSRDRSVGIATRYGLDGPGIESLWGRYFPHPVQTDPGAHPASYTMGTGSLSRGQNGRGVALTIHIHLVPKLRKSRAIPLLHLWVFLAYSSLNFTFTFLLLLRV